MKGKSWDITALERLDDLVLEILDVASSEENDNAVLLALEGDLGAGKTTFTQKLAAVLGISETITSPTFVLMKKYAIASHPRFKTLVHVDAYRLESSEELRVLGFEEELKNPTNLICLEWPNRVPDLLPQNAILLSFTIETGKRTVVRKT